MIDSERWPPPVVGPEPVRVDIWKPHRPLLLVAIFGALVIHGGLALYGSYANTYDAYIHMFFADHWLRSWFDHWEPRWYTGFTMTSYPPLSHQSMALLSLLTGDLRTAFVIIQTTAMAVLTIGMYRFATLWVDDEGAQWAALWLVLSSGVAETVHVFGQLPTIVSLCLLLNALPFVYQWIDGGHKRNLWRAWALIAATTGAHHVTTLFGAVFIIAPVVLLALLQHLHQPLPNEATTPMYWTRRTWWPLVARHLRRVLGPVLRTALFGIGAVALLLIIVWPYWSWSRFDPISQVPIPHASRDNFLVNLNAGLIFWVIPYGMLIPLMPYIFLRGFSNRAWPLTASIALMAFLGTGGTTPFPKLLLGGAFDILTLDRFTLWAAILMAPLAGHFITSLNGGAVGRWLQQQVGRVTWHAVQLLLAIGVVAFFVFTVSLPQFRRFQPAPIDMQPIVNFINKDQHWRWRYLTLGFGDQMAWLSIQTDALQVDGNYHSARRLPEMTTTSVERLEGAKFRGIPGIGSLQQFLNVPEKYNLKYIFSNDNFYDPLLFFYGWHRIGALENDIVVWEREDIPVLPEVLPRREVPLYHRVMFGTLPLAALLAALLTTTSAHWSLPLHLFAELLGLEQSLAWLRRRQQRATAGLTRWTNHYLMEPLDSRLLAVAQLGELAELSAPPWQRHLQNFWEALQARGAAVNAQTRRTHLYLVIATVILLTMTGVLWLQWQHSRPQAVVAAYYDDIDFKRFTAAYERMNPQTRPPFEEFMLNLSVQGGLLSSYSKLDGLTMTTVLDEARHNELAVTARYITALAYYTNTTTITLDWVAGQWKIAPPPVDLTVPPDQFLRSPEVNWLAQGRRRVASETTNFADVLDRPDLAVLSARLVVDTRGQYSIVGEVQNQDVDPADITVSGAVYDNRKNRLTWYNAGDVIIHKLLPLEITPFRIDFEGVAGATLTAHITGAAQPSLEFSPGATWPFVFPDASTLGTFDVVAKAVVTQRDLYRALGVQKLTIAENSDGQLVVHGELINNDLREATVPHLLITLYDERGKVLWVDDHYLPAAIRPQRIEPFTVALTAREQLQEITIPAEIYTNSLQNQVELDPIRSDFVAIPGNHAYHFLRVSVNYFVEE
ncbi:MAG TPA: hypothetical protein P5121_06675 [Caldilineaceae bacterium]|nr:hypothetical protein [Caldilineaceae bacterium]